MKDFKVYQTSGMLNFLVHKASDVRKTEQTLSGDIVSFTADAQSPIKIIVDIDSTGWTGAKVTRAGKNILEPKFYNGGAYNGDVGRQFTFTEDTSVVKTGNVYSKSVGGWGGVTLVSNLLKVGMYKINIAISAPNVRSTLYTLDKDYRVVWKGNTSIPQTWSNTIVFDYEGYIAVYLASSTAGDITFTEPQIEIGETFTGYEEYQGTTLSITFPDEVGSVTDGTLTIDYDGAVTLETGGQSYTLTSVSPIETLVGDNNIWADTGEVSVTYLI